MFTTGSKLFIGATTLAVAGTLVYAWSQSDSTLGTISLIFAAIALAVLTGFNFWVRDSNVSSMDTAGIERSAAAQGPPQRSFWPLVAAFGVAVIPVGLVIGRPLVWAGIIIILASTVEWMVQAWSERASGDSAYNQGLRRRVLHPLELPLLGAVGLGVVIFSFSRIMLWLPSSAAAAIIFGSIATAVLAFGALIATQRKVATSLVVVICTLGGVSLVGAGVAAAVAGPRPIEKHEVPSYELGTCTQEQTAADENSSRIIAAKSNFAATITLENGELTAQIVGVEQPLTTVPLPRSLDSFIRFRNLDEGEYRLVADFGSVVIDPNATPPVTRDEQYCTQAVGQGGTQFLVVHPGRPSVASDRPYTFTVPGTDGAITIEVP